MAIVTGWMTQITGLHMNGLEPRLYVTIPKNTVDQNGVMVTRQQVVTPDSSGQWSINLVPQSFMRGTAPDYGLKLEWLDSSGTAGVPDYPDFTFRVPFEGGEITDLIVTRPSAFETWIGTTPPPELESYLWWFNPGTGDFFEWSD